MGRRRKRTVRLANKAGYRLKRRLEVVEFAAPGLAITKLRRGIYTLTHLESGLTPGRAGSLEFCHQAAALFPGGLDWTRPATELHELWSDDTKAWICRAMKRVDPALRMTVATRRREGWTCRQLRVREPTIGGAR